MDMLDKSVIWLSAGRRISRDSVRHMGWKIFVFVLFCLSSVGLASGSQPQLLKQSTKEIVAVRFTPSGNLLSASRDGTVSLWNPGSERPVWSISFKRPKRTGDATRIEINDMDMSRDGRLAVVAYLHSGVDMNLADSRAGGIAHQKLGVHKPHLVVIDTADGTIKQDYQDFQEITFERLLLSPHGKSVFVTTAISGRPVDEQTPVSTTRIISLENGREVLSFQSRDRIVRAALSPDGKLYAALTFRYLKEGRSAYHLDLFDAESGHLLRRNAFATTRSLAIGFSTDGRGLMISRSANESLSLDRLSIDGAEKPVRSTSIEESAKVQAMAFMSRQRIALAGGELPITGVGDTGEQLYADKSGVVLIIDEMSGKSLKRHTFKSFVTSIAISRDGSKLAAGMYNGHVAITTTN